MRQLAQIEYVCTRHPHKPQADCDGCAFLQRAEHEAEALRGRRVKLLIDIKDAIKAKRIVIADVK